MHGSCQKNLDKKARCRSNLTIPIAILVFLNFYTVGTLLYSFTYFGVFVEYIKYPGEMLS